MLQGKVKYERKKSNSIRSKEVRVTKSNNGSSGWALSPLDVFGIVHKRSF